MGKAKQKNGAEIFSKELIRSWEDSDGVNFAIALARVTGWLLHVDWWRPGEDVADVNKMKSLRVYVGDNADNIFDVQGKKRIASFSNNIILPLAKKRGNGKGGVLTRYYSEQKLMEMPLRVRPDLIRVNTAEELIRNTPAFVENVPIRQAPFIPAHQAADFTFGNCAVFATALQDINNLPATAMVAVRYNKLFELSKVGYVHSVIIHSDGKAEDVWGIQTIDEIAARFGIAEYKLSVDEHQRVIENLKTNSPEKYRQLYEEAITLIRNYRL